MVICENVEIQSIQSKKDIYLSNGYLFILSVPLTAEQEIALRPFIAYEASHWDEIYQFLKLGLRTVLHDRNTKETKISFILHPYIQRKLTLHLSLDSTQ